MTIDLTKPYIVIPKLIHQPTWGGSRIIELQKCEKFFKGHEMKIGQSYQLYGQSKFAANLNDTGSADFVPEVGNPDDGSEHPDFKLDPAMYITLQQLVDLDGEQTVGPYVWKTFGKMPLLNKVNDSMGNSFQLHLKQGETHTRWIPKAESWYYLDDGIVTYGLVAGCNIEAYKAVCKDIEAKMKSLSEAVKSGEKELLPARLEAKMYIKDRNPWQFVNTYRINKHQILDLSPGGIHHSWEERSALVDMEGIKSNFVYEVQEDVMDPVCTIRSFDQGKIKDDGSIREIHIDDYFALIDTSAEYNDIKTALHKPNGHSILKTRNYSVDVIELELGVPLEQSVTDSFVHFFVRDGVATVKTSGGEVRITQGHSCFIPFAAGSYTVTPETSGTCLIKTYIEQDLV